MSPRIAIFTKNRTNPAYEAARIGADRTARRLGASTIHYVPEQPDNVTEQVALIGRAIAQQPDATVFVPVHETQVNDAILGFDAARIPLFNFITRTTIGQRKCFVGSDDRALAAAIARYLVAKLNGRGKIVIIEGTPASATSRERLEGFHDVLADCPDIEVLVSLRGEYQRDVTRDAFLAAADRVRDIDAVLCANDVMALGVLDALEHFQEKWKPVFRSKMRQTQEEATGNPGRPLVVGVNAIPEAVAAIAAGRMLATANFDAMTMSSIATEAAVRHLRGEDVPREIIIPVKIVDAANYSAWNLPFEARACPSWQDVTGAP